MSSNLLGSPGDADLLSSSPGDAQIVEQCLEGDQQAWTLLLNKYRRLIQSISLKYGATPDDAADIFQTVSIDVFSDLPKLREPQALRAWLMQVTSRKCLQWKEAQQRRAEEDLTRIELNLPACLIVPPTLLEIDEEEQQLRAAVARLPDRLCQLVRMLFFEQPPRPYKEIAEALGVARGSIPFLRARCLKQLAQILEEMELERGANKLRS
jgi:RNA polymerase sigma factor (sigma-70 family)